MPSRKKISRAKRPPVSSTPAAPQAAGPWFSRRENRQTVAFCLLFGLFMGAGYLLSIYRPVIAHIVLPFTAFIAKASGIILRLLGENAQTAGTRLMGSGVAFELRNGCNGVWATIIYVSAVLAFPSKPGAKLWGVVFGFVGIFVVNLVRVISLYLIVRYYPKGFEGAHIYVWQTVVISIAVFLWLFWAKRSVSLGPDAPISP